MSNRDSGPEAAASGVVEGVKGFAKEIVGTVTDNDRLVEEGRAQQSKAQAEREVAEKEAEAEKARAEAEAHELRQKAAQR